MNRRFALLGRWGACTLVASASFLAVTRAHADEPVTPAAPQDPPVPPATTPAQPEVVEPDGACAFAPKREARRGLGLETNVLWPFFPGGIFEVRLMIPVLRTDQRDFRGEIVTGAYSDFTTRVVRDDEHGKVANLSGKIGYRQFFVYGTHIEVSANVGWRQEKNRPSKGSEVYPATIDAFQTRLWVLGGYQHELSRIVYANARFGAGFHVYRSDAYAYLEKEVALGGDLNVGFRF